MVNTDNNFVFRFKICIILSKETVACSEAVVTYKLGVLKNFAKFSGKHLYQNLFFNFNFAKFLRSPFLQNTSSGCLCMLKKDKSNYQINRLNGGSSSSKLTIKRHEHNYKEYEMGISKSIREAIGKLG